MGRVGVGLLVSVLGIVAAVGCSALGDGKDGSQGHEAGQAGTGTIGAQLTLPGGEHLSAASYKLTNGTYSYAGNVDISATNMLSFTITSVVAGGGYTLSVTGGSDDGTVTCNSSVGPITVVNQTTTSVSVALECTVNQGRDAGSLAINGTATNCPVWNTIVANPVDVTLDAGANVDDSGSTGSTSIFPGVAPVPADIGVGQSLVLVGGAAAPDPGMLAFHWSTTGGSLSSATGTRDPNSNDAGAENQTLFTCPPVPGPITITLTLTDGPIPPGGGCDAPYTTGTVTVNCQAAPACTFGTGCGTGSICNAAGNCVPALFSVLTLNGIDGGIIDSHGTYLPVSIQNYNLSGTPVGSAVTLPTSASGGQQAVTLMGNTVTEGDLTTSEDGRYLVTTGWNVLPAGHLSGTSNPVIARIAANGTVDTSTVVTGAFGGLTARSVVSHDGAEFWVSGASSDTSPGNAGGIWYESFGSTAPLQLLSSPDGINQPDVYTRWIRLFGGQLYSGTDESPPYMVSVGSGEPSAGTPALTTLPGAFTTWSGPTPSPYAFAAFNLFGGAGPDTLYIADDGINPTGSNDVAGPGSVSTGGGGLAKWSFTPATGWSRIWNINAGTFPADAGTVAGAVIGFRGVAGFATGTTVTLMATTADTEGNPDSLAVVVVDNGAVTPPPVTVVATTSLSRVFRGVALTPQ